MAGSATLAQCFMDEYERPNLFPVTFGAALVLARHHQAAPFLMYVHPVRVVALDAIHFAFPDRMVLRQVDFDFGLDVTTNAGSRIVPRVYNEAPSSASGGNVPAARS